MIRIGIIGYGHRVACLATGQLKNIAPDMQVAGVVDPNEAGVRKRLSDWGCEDQKNVPFFKDIHELIRKTKPDGLIIGTRCNLHTPLAIQAAKYDIPLYLEKPVSISMRQAMDLEKAFRKTRCQVVVSFPLRVSPLCERVKDDIREGVVGKAEHIAALNYVPYGTCYWQEGYRNFAVTQGLFLQKATHDLDYMTYLMGSPIVRVAAMATYGHVFGGKKRKGLSCSTCDATVTCPESPDNRRRVGLGSKKETDHPCLYSVDCGSPATGTNEDCSSCLVEFATGAHGVYTQVFFTRRDAGRRGSIVSGYKGTVSFDWYTGEIRRVRHFQPFSDTVKGSGGEGGHFSGDDELARDFFGLIRGRIKRSRTPIETGLASVYACLAAKASAETGRFVKVRQVGL